MTRTISAGTTTCRRTHARAVAQAQVAPRVRPGPYRSTLHVLGAGGQTLQTPGRKRAGIPLAPSTTQRAFQHDTEMDRIRPALHAKFSGAVPLLETYKQQCIRLQKAKDWTVVSGRPEPAWPSTERTRQPGLKPVASASGLPSSGQSWKHQARSQQEPHTKEVTGVGFVDRGADLLPIPVDHRRLPGHQLTSRGG